MGGPQSRLDRESSEEDEVNSDADNLRETESLDPDQPRLKIGYLSAMDIFQDLTPEESDGSAPRRKRLL